MREFALLLSQHSNLPEDLVAFACLGDDQFPIRTGANRNTLLLATAGEMMLQVDDDTICTIEPCPEAEDGLVLSSAYTCSEFWLPSDEFPFDQSPPSSETSANIDICALHEQLLGKTIRECINDHGPPVRQSEGWSSSASQTGPPDHRRVLATNIGVSGDSTVATRLYLLQSGGAQHDKLVSSDSVYRSVMVEGQIRRVARHRTVSDRGLVSGTNFAVDNSTVLPPFTPVQQCQDSIFTVLLSSCFDAYVGFLPWSITHKRPVRHNSSTETVRQRTYLLSGDLIWLMIPFLAKELTAGTPETKLVALGKLFREWASAPPLKFQEMVRGLIIRHNSIQLNTFDWLLQKYSEQPDFWASDVKLYRSWIRKAIPDPELDITNDLSDAFGATEARVKLQQLVFRFGQLLEVWPALHQTATELHAQGIRVGTKL